MTFKSVSKTVAAIALSASFVMAAGPSGAACVNAKKGFDLIAKSPIDECFKRIGRNYPPIINDECVKGQPKRNEGYVWALTETRRHLYWGTVANPACVFLVDPQSDQTPTLAPEQGMVCEYDQGLVARNNPGLMNLGDWRPVSAYRMDTCTLEVEEITPDIGKIRDLLGLRAAGTIGNLVLMGGPAGVRHGATGADGGDGVIVMAWHAKTGAFLGAKKFPDFVNIRNFIAHDGALYSGIAVQQSLGGGGQVLRWTGTPKDPFAFQVVGETVARPAHFAVHDGRLFATTWPNIDVDAGVLKAVAGVVMSPVIPAGGLTAQHANDWETVWTFDQYEPSPVTAATYGGGAIESWHGQLYWGSMHFPGASIMAHVRYYGETWTNPLEQLQTYLSTNRATSVFRGGNFGELNQSVELLYGETELPVYDPGTGTFVDTPTRAGPPLFGASGFGSPYTAYTWVAGVTKGDLFLGTFDSSRLTAAGLEGNNSLLGPLPGLIGDLVIDQLTDPTTSGAELYRFFDPDEPAVAMTINGINNSANYGFRTLVDDEKFMWLGTANPFNLAPEGGWELQRFKPGKSPAAASALSATEAAATQESMGMLEDYAAGRLPAE